MFWTYRLVNIQGGILHGKKKGKSNMADAKTEKQKVKKFTDKPEEGLKELSESVKYKNYLSPMSKFHNYSVNNTLLIALQRADASLAAGCQAWQRNFKRHVSKGERVSRILAPAPYKIKEERDKLDPVTGEIKCFAGMKHHAAQVLEKE